jgi:transposase
LDVIQAPRREPRFKPRGIARVDDRRILNGIFWVLRSGAPWAICRKPVVRAHYHRFVRWRQAGVWDRMMDALAAGHDAAVQMIDTSVANYLAFIKLASVRFWLRANEFAR